jgi:hypothetical protein
MRGRESQVERGVAGEREAIDGVRAVGAAREGDVGAAEGGVGDPRGSRPIMSTRTDVPTTAFPSASST